MNADEPRDFPKIDVVFETASDGIVGRTSASIKRIELQDDESYTVVIDYWPISCTKVVIPTEAMEKEFATQRRLGIAQGLDESVRLVIYELGEDDPVCESIVSQLLKRKNSLPNKTQVPRVDPSEVTK